MSNDLFSKRYLDLKEKTDNSTYLDSLNKKQLEELKSEAKEVQQQYKNLELIVKRDANSLYGTSASIYFSLVDFDISEDITQTGRHYTVLVDREINKFFVNWGNDAFEKIKEFYPNCTGIKQFTQYKPDTVDDICVYGDTDSRYLDISMIYDLLDNVEYPALGVEGDKELSDFAIFLMDNFINDVIKKTINDDVTFRNANHGYLKMTHEVTTRKMVVQAKKKYVMVVVWKDGKFLTKPDLVIKGVELKKGELNKRIKKIIRVLVDKFMIEDYSINQLRNETIKLIKYIKHRKEKTLIYKITSVNGLKEIVKDDHGVYRSTKSHIQMKIACSWFNFLEQNNLTGEYKPPFEGQKMYFYYTESGDVIGIPDDVDMEKVVGLPEPDWNKMLNQILVKPLLRYIKEADKITEKDIEYFLLGLQDITSDFLK